MSVSPKNINRFMKYISGRVYSPCLVPQGTELFFAFNKLFFQKHCKWRKFNRPKENKSGHLYKSQPNACSWLWHVLNFQTLEGLISADHIWYIIVQSKYIQTYCIQKCRNKWITKENLSWFIFAFLYDQYIIWLGIQAGEISCTSSGHPDWAERLNNGWSHSWSNQFSTQKGSFWLYIWM